MPMRLSSLAVAVVYSFVLLWTGVNLAAQSFILPSPMKVIPVSKLDFDPDANNSCVSVEGPEIVTRTNGTSETVSDDFTTCALNLFAPLLDSKYKDGTQKTNEAIDALSRCANASISAKHLILVGHGSPGSIATGNGTNPQASKNQNIDIGTQEAIDKLRLLKGLELVLFGCETGVGEDARQLLNKLADQKFPTRARNSLVMCSLDDAHNGALKGLYVFKGADQLWVTAEPTRLLARSNEGAPPVELDSDSCFALKGKDRQFKVMTPEQFKLKIQHGDISLFDFQSESALRGHAASEFDILFPRAFTQDNFHFFVAQDSVLLDSIDFCEVLRPDLVPDSVVAGKFILKIDGDLRHFNQLSGGLVQDAEHTEVYYRAKYDGVTRLHVRTLEENRRLFQLQQEKLQHNQENKK